MARMHGGSGVVVLSMEDMNIFGSTFEITRLAQCAVIDHYQWKSEIQLILVLVQYNFIKMPFCSVGNILETV